MFKFGNAIIHKPDHRMQQNLVGWSCMYQKIYACILKFMGLEKTASVRNVLVLV